MHKLNLGCLNWCNPKLSDCESLSLQLGIMLTYLNSPNKTDDEQDSSEREEVYNA